LAVFFPNIASDSLADVQNNTEKMTPYFSGKDETGRKRNLSFVLFVQNHSLEIAT
jgi:hypothetical protein